MEGPSVHHLAEQLAFFKGQTVEFAGGNADQPIDTLSGRTLQDVRAVKKRLFFDAGEVHAVVHFLMFGSYRVNETREGMQPRLVLDCSQDVFLTYNSSVDVLRDHDDTLAVYDTPSEDVLNERFDRHRARSALRRDERPLVDVLLDQRIFGGIGNILKNETLYRCSLFPGTRASELTDSEAETLVDQAVELSRRWLEQKRRGSSLNTQVYRHKQCERCGHRIVREKLGDYNRITDWCPRCQCK